MTSIFHSSTIVCRLRHWCLLEARKCLSSWREEDLKGEVGLILPQLCKKRILTTVIIYRGSVLAFTGRFGQSTPPLVEFLKDILRRYPEGGQILKVSVLPYYLFKDLLADINLAFTTVHTHVHTCWKFRVTNKPNCLSSDWGLKLENAFLYGEPHTDLAGRFKPRMLAVRLLHHMI